VSDDLDDLCDWGGRARRIFVATFVGVACAVLAVKICLQLVRGGCTNTDFFILFSTGIAFAGGFAVTSVILNALAALRWREQRIPRAKLRR
jgi:hypothetical protein